jgi:hypothetical protein
MDQTATAHEHPRRRRRLAALLILSLVSGTVGAGALSLALFTDTDTATGSFTTGTIDIVTNPSTLFTVTNMMPGDVRTAVLTVQNNGSGQFRYAMTSTATNTDGKGLRSQLQLDLYPNATCTGATIYSDVLFGAGFGNPAQGNDAGDRVLNGATSEQLCFSVTLPLATPNTFQAATTTATFTFDAEQTAHN